MRRDAAGRTPATLSRGSTDGFKAVSVLAASAPGTLVPAQELMTALAQSQPPRPSLDQAPAAQARPAPLLADLGAQQRNSLPPRPVAPVVGSDSLKRGVTLSLSPCSGVFMRTRSPLFVSVQRLRTRLRCQ